MGRKKAFLTTLVVMGASTCAIGLLPSYASIGFLAPLTLVTLRLIQGLALGGEYGGAAVYVAEHAPEGRRGYYTSFIYTTATVALLGSLLVILATRRLTGETEFAAWGWRIPFLVSSILVAISYYVRRKLDESPMCTGPLGALLVEAFPTRVRYTGVSFVHHAGTGWFGGFLPLIATALVARTGNPYAGLWYPIAVTTVTFVVGVLLVRERSAEMQ